jgi:hypothetical protein
MAELRQTEARALRELAELESTIADLEQREGARTEETIAAKREAEKRKAELHVLLLRTRERFEERQRARRIRLGIALAALVGAGLLAAKLVPAMTTGLAKTTSEINAAAAPFEASGFSEVRTSWGVEAADLATDKGRCFVVVGAAADGPARLRVQRGFTALDAQGSAGWCACAPEPVKITPSGKEPLALRILSADASVVGGADLFATRTPHPATVMPETVDRACAELALDQWMAAHPPAAPAALGPVAKKLDELGAKAIGAAGADDAFVVVPPSQETCFAAIAGEASELALRLPGGARPVTTKRPALAFCTKAARPLSVWRAGRGAVTVLAAPAQRVGGALGMRGLVERAGASAVATWVAPEELAFDANATLVASGISPSLALDPSALARASIVVFSTDARSTVAIDAGDPAILCRPAVTVGAVQSLCLEARPGAWSPPEGLPAGAVAAERPSWMPATPSDRARLERTLDVLAFARRMALSGFDLATFGGVQPTATGARITGRSGEKEIVALALGTAPPYVAPLSDGTPWTIDGAPHVVALRPGQTVELTPGKPVPSLGAREILVWRR